MAGDGLALALIGPHPDGAARGRVLGVQRAEAAADPGGEGVSLGVAALPLAGPTHGGSQIGFGDADGIGHGGSFHRRKPDPLSPKRQ